MSENRAERLCAFMKGNSFVWLVLILSLAVISACSNSENTDSVQNASAQADEVAASLYKKHCLSCHAADFSGLVGPSLKQVGTKFTEEQIIAVMNDGAKGMPSFTKMLSKEEMEAVAGWLSKNE
ncbi:c-type cytochrome [Brevibacillus reuszeri]|uniref:c-type cytochrome n=1 Tax=Brevibacillus reuszeri TaxID=54915 RepID=UPI00289B8C0A|nr:cytochrome c [Brevibacillus reuszeri]